MNCLSNNADTASPSNDDDDDNNNNIGTNKTINNNNNNAQSDHVALERGILEDDTLEGRFTSKCSVSSSVRLFDNECMRHAESYAYDEINKDHMSTSNYNNENCEVSNCREGTLLSSKRILICDAGYGLPREARPRKEKILANARQIVNFLVWQYEAFEIISAQSNPQKELAQIKVIGCRDEESRVALQERTRELLVSPNTATSTSTTTILSNALLDYVEFSCQPLEEYLSSCLDTFGIAATPSTGRSATINSSNIDSMDNTTSNTSSIVYLSPDAETALDPFEPPPSIAIVGLLIDRRIQPNRSKDRALLLHTQKN